MKKRICEDCRENDKALIPVLNMKTRKIIYRCWPGFMKKSRLFLMTFLKSFWGM